VFQLKQFGNNSLSNISGKSIIDILISKSHFFVFSYSITQKILLSWSENAEEILGVKDASIARDGNLFLRHVHSDDRFALLTELEKAFKGESSYRATYRWIRPDTDETHWLHCRAGLTVTDSEKIFEGIIIDLSNEFTGEMSRIAGPDSVQTILSALPTLVFTVDQDLRLLRINRPKGAQLFNFGDEHFNFEELKIGRNLLETFTDPELKDGYKKITNAILEGRIPHHRRRIALEETVFNLEITALSDKDLIQGLLFIVSDITEIVRLEKEMANLQKADGLRLLAAGVAHNFNNALQGILGHASILAGHSDNKEFVAKAGNSIIELVNRASDLTKQLLANDQENQDRPTALDLNTISMAAINAVEDLFTSGIKVSVTFGNPEIIIAPKYSLIEAIVAILKNAKEAICNCEEKTKSLTIKTSQARIGDCEISDLKAGSYTKLSITDSGSGMESQTLKRCFEPFFTTKEHDPQTGVGIKPSGLGLPKALAIIRSLEGALDIESVKDFGTTVSIYLPVKEEIIPESDKIISIKKIHPEILIIDDDLMVLNTVQGMITDLGYDCITADDSKKAHMALRQNLRSLRLIILDAIMPGADGATVLKGLKKINPQIKVIGFSGATPQQTYPLIQAGALQILRKPVGQTELKQVIESLLGNISKVATNL